MLLRCQQILGGHIHRSSGTLLANANRIQARNFSQQTFRNVSLLWKIGIDSYSREVGPFLRHCFRQLDYVAAQKAKRGQQWLRFYTQLWSRDRLSCLLKQMGRRFGIAFRHRRISGFILGGSAIVPLPYVVDVQAEDKDGTAGTKAEFATSNIINKRPNLIEDTVSDDLIASHTKDLDYIHQLKETTLTCMECQKRHVIDQKVNGVDYCQCHKKCTSVYGVSASSKDNDDSTGGWLPFLERKDVLVWRRENPEHRGLYAYKMYGRFDDVTAKEFLEVQMDVSAFRLSWDISTAQCHILIEEQGENSLTSSDATDNHRQQPTSDVRQIYFWEVDWPRFFSNRDYVCTRRACVYDDQNNDNEKVIVVYTRSTSHPSCPEKIKNFRVKDYWSVMTIKPFKELDEMGIEFSLTAFENPGLSLPSSVTTWVAIRGMPEFMANLRKACFQMRKWKNLHQQTDVNSEPISPKSGNTSPLSSGKEEPSYMESPTQYSHTSTNYGNKAYG